MTRIPVRNPGTVVEGKVVLDPTYMACVECMHLHLEHELEGPGLSVLLWKQLRVPSNIS